MPASTTYEDYILRQEEFISQPKLNNLMRILGVIHSQSKLHPENPYLTIKSIRELTNLQPTQVTAAMNQHGMKVLFTGKGIAFGLSDIGRETVAGERQLSLTGVSANSSTATNSASKGTLLQPLTKEEFNAQDEETQAKLRKVDTYVRELLIKHLSPTFGPTAYGDEEFKRMLARSIIFEAQRTLTKLAHPNAHESTSKINAAKPTMSTASPIREDSVPERANATA